MSLRYVKINQDELHKIKDLYEGVMSHACHGLFFKEGSVIGADMAEDALKDRSKFQSRAARSSRSEAGSRRSRSKMARWSSKARSRCRRATSRRATDYVGYSASSTNVLKGRAFSVPKWRARASGNPNVGFASRRCRGIRVA